MRLEHFVQFSPSRWAVRLVARVQTTTPTALAIRQRLTQPPLAWRSTFSALNEQLFPSQQEASHLLSASDLAEPSATQPPSARQHGREAGRAGMCSRPISLCHTNISQFTLKRAIVAGIRGPGDTRTHTSSGEHNQHLCSLYAGNGLWLFFLSLFPKYQRVFEQL